MHPNVCPPFGEQPITICRSFRKKEEKFAPREAHLGANSWRRRMGDFGGIDLARGLQHVRCPFGKCASSDTRVAQQAAIRHARWAGLGSVNINYGGRDPGRARTECP